MKARRVIATIISLGMLVCYSALAYSQVDTTQTIQPPQTSKDNLTQYRKQLDDLAQTLTKTFSIPILVDPGVTPMQKVVCNVNASDLIATLNSLVSNIPDTSWKRVYCKMGDKGEIPSAAKIAPALRALDAMGDMDLVVDNGSDKSLSSVFKPIGVLNDLDKTLTDHGIKKAPVIVLYYSPKDFASLLAGEPLTQKINSLQRQQLQYMLQMDPMQISQSVKQSMSMFMQLDPNTRMQMLSGFMRGGFEMIQSLTPDQRQEFFSNMSQVFKQIRNQQGGNTPQ